MSDWKADPQMVDDYIEQDEAIEDVYVPFLNCGWKSSEDGCCSHPNNATPECHQFCCPIRVAVEHTLHLTRAGSGNQADENEPPAQVS